MLYSGIHTGIKLAISGGGPLNMSISDSLWLAIVAGQESVMLRAIVGLHEEYRGSKPETITTNFDRDRLYAFKLFPIDCVWLCGIG